VSALSNPTLVKFQMTKKKALTRNRSIGSRAPFSGLTATIRDVRWYRHARLEPPRRASQRQREHAETPIANHA
jgi:hypothetical protein